MAENEIQLNSSDFEEDRYSRLRLIPWWDQERLKNATVMVVGAGAIGNELIKNLALLGIGRILIFDMDGNRYIMPEFSKTDVKSQRLLEPYLY